MKFLCEQCKAKYQIADDKVVGKTVRMKCRKCGHLIEVRAAITESSVASVPPAAPAGSPAGSLAKPAQRPAPPRATPLGASLASARSMAPKPQSLPSGLANTFKTSVQREDESSAPFDMSELSPGDDWYVAVNGVPVGPIRVAEVRRKASLGAVTEDSLVWQEGLDEWRPLRSFPDLAVIVREAASTGRSSMTPPPSEVRSGSLAPPARSVSLRPSAPMGSQSVNPRVGSPRVGAGLGAPLARSNVVPITSRLATAEKLDEPVPNPFAPRAPAAAQPFEKPLMAAPEALAFVPAASVAPAGAVPATDRSTLESLPPRSSQRKGPPWIIFGMIGMFIAFGITAAILVVPILTHPPAPAASVPPPPSATAVPAAAPATAAPTAEVAAAPTVTANTPASKGGTGRGTGPGGTGGPSATSTGKGLDLSGLTGGPRVAPTDELSGDGNRAPGQCLSEGQVQQTIAMHSIALRRSCWERNPSAKGSANVSVSLTIVGDGSSQNISSTGDDPTVAHCIENDVKNWHFPAMGCTQKIAVPFKFVRQ